MLRLLEKLRIVRFISETQRIHTAYGFFRESHRLDGRVADYQLGAYVAPIPFNVLFRAIYLAWQWVKVPMFPSRFEQALRDQHAYGFHRGRIAERRYVRSLVTAASQAGAASLISTMEDLMRQERESA